MLFRVGWNRNEVTPYRRTACTDVPIDAPWVSASFAGCLAASFFCFPGYTTQLLSLIFLHYTIRVSVLEHRHTA